LQSRRCPIREQKLKDVADAAAAVAEVTELSEKELNGVVGGAGKTAKEAAPTETITLAFTKISFNYFKQ
jgi:bacteriocin-like protein